MVNKWTSAQTYSQNTIIAAHIKYDVERIVYIFRLAQENRPVPLQGRQATRDRIRRGLEWMTQGE